MAVGILCLALLRDLRQRVMQLLRFRESIDSLAHVFRRRGRPRARLGRHEHAAIGAQHSPGIRCQLPAGTARFGPPRIAVNASVVPDDKA